MVVNPNTVSHFLDLEMFLYTDITASKNASALPGIPSKLLNWEAAITKAAADVNPDITGYEKNSTRKPVGIIICSLEWILIIFSKLYTSLVDTEILQPKLPILLVFSKKSETIPTTTPIHNSNKNAMQSV